MSISSISPLTTSSLQGISQGVKTNAASQKTSLGDTFSQVLNTLNESQTNTDTLVSQLASGKDVDVADVMIASTENDVNFRVAMAIRDKLVDAYREVMRMNF
jgi:flagellar hook-basal body complex protein FliE